ncbi:glycosyltransferase [Mucisphaera calidilacus]|uniref:4,4'-diaponeurosporenoate glycosyltransferase n=1 Tax=Mucisphaera calidilacus TaxID=2527982 RepID=A0A518BYD1_9BACT|nr:glycosyltransferase [Mucisphaera calidilacus]QDU71989.1 4,4'-diaponeurosporenoate glycosyltransferase [Mucisphaera calidilacus]
MTLLAALWWTWTLALAGATLLWLRVNTSDTHRSNTRYQVEPPAPDEDTDDNLPPVALLVPARNEAEHLPETLESLCRQNYPDLTLVFVDDDSTDDTAKLADQLAQRYPHLHVLHNQQAPPPGWVGKPHALYRGYQHLRQIEAAGAWQATWLCFTDADIHWHPDCLRAAIRHAQQHDADLVGLYPGLRFGTWVEAVVQTQLILALAVLFPVDKAMDPKVDETLIGGAFILTRRDNYDAIGGHEAVHNFVVEDLALGRRLKKNGARVRLAAARDLLWCRMYNGWLDLWEGLTKNAYAGLRYNPFRVTFLILCTFTFNILPALSIIPSAIAWYLTRDPAFAWPTLLALAANLLGTSALNASRIFARLPWHHALTLPVGSAIYLAIILASVRDYYFGGNHWKGRTYGTDVKKRGV